MPVQLQIHSPTPTRLAAPLRKLLRLLHITTGTWSITLVRDPEMTALHARTLGLNSTTDVLTFDLRDPNPNLNPKSRVQRSALSVPLDLDTIVCLDQARRSAKDLGHSLHHELLLYALHSLLHVQGYDDTTPQKSQRMHAREDELLKKIGIGPVYKKLKPQDSRLKAPNQKAKSKKQKSLGGGGRSP